MQEEINLLLKEFVKEIIDGKYNDEFINIHRRKEEQLFPIRDGFISKTYEGRAGKPILRETDYDSDLGRQLLNTELLLSIFNLQDNMLENKEMVTVENFAQYKERILNNVVLFENLSLKKKKPEYSNFYVDFVVLGINEFYDLEDYMAGNADESIIPNIMKSISILQSKVDSWLMDYREESYRSSSISHVLTAQYIQENIKGLTKKMEHVEIHRYFQSLIALETDQFINTVGEKAVDILNMINDYNIEITNYMDDFIKKYKNLTLDDYKEKDYKVITGLYKIMNNNVYRRRVSNEEESIFHQDIVFALTRKLFKEKVLDKKEEIKKYYLLNLSSKDRDMIEEEIELFQYDTGVNLKEEKITIHRISMEVKDSLMKSLFKETKDIVEKFYELSRISNDFKFTVSDTDKVCLIFSSESENTLQYSLKDFLESLRGEEVTMQKLVDALEDFRLKTQLKVKDEAVGHIRSKI